MPDSSLSTNKTIDRAIQLLESLANDGLSLNVAEISRYLDVTRVTAQSIVNSLKQANYIELDPETGRYSFGFKMFTVGNRYIYRYPFLHAAAKHVEQVSHDMKLKINVSVLKPNGQLIILLSRDVSLIPYMAVGSLVPGNLAASSKILLAQYSREKRDAIIDAMEFHQSTKYSITDPEIFKKSLDQYKAQGFATESEELVLRRGCIAAPIFDISGNPIAAVSISENIDRINNEFDSLVQEVQLLGKLISAELGYYPAIL